jgi:hypothetical protein
MAKVIRVSISFDYYPDEDDIMIENDFTEEELVEYYKSAYVDDIYSYVKYNELYEAVDVEILNV